MWRFSRSHVSTDQECSRKLLLGYYFAGTGIERRGLNLEMETGQLIHTILTNVLKGVKLEDAIVEAKLNYEIRVTQRGFEFPLDDQALALEIKRQSALAEGLARAWCKVRLPYYLVNGEIISVEKEHNVPLGDDIELMTRIDAIWRRKDGEVFAGPEFKSTSYVNQQWIEAWRYSSQVLTHLKGAESLLGEKIAGVKMEFLYKGTKRNDPATNQITYYSPLIRGALKIGKTFDEIVEIAHGKKQDVPEYAFSADQARKKGWRAFEAWREMEVREWLEIVPPPVLESQLYYTDVFKNEEVVDLWMEQQKFRQTEVKTGLVMLADIYSNATEIVFPARYDSWCFSNQFHKKCEFLPVCYGEIVGNPLDNGYVRRVSHHEQEFSV